MRNRIARAGKRRFIKGWLGAGLIAAAGLALAAGGAEAETRITYKSAKSTSSYYQMAVQVTEAVQQATDGALQLTVEESQGSVQNVKEAALREGNYVFTTPPVLINLAKGNKKMFEDGKDYADIRALFVIPSLTMHYVVRADAGIDSFQDLAGKDFIIGKGSFGAREAASNFEQFGVSPDLVDVELNSAGPALQNGQVDGFATAGSYPRRRWTRRRPTASPRPIGRASRRWRRPRAGGTASRPRCWRPWPARCIPARCATMTRRASRCRTRCGRARPVPESLPP